METPLYFHISLNNNNIEELIDLHERINIIQKTLSNNILINYNFDVDNNNVNTNNINTNIYIKNNLKKNIENYCPICNNNIFKNNYIKL
jgi:hypothetical protein